MIAPWHAIAACLALCAACSSDGDRDQPDAGASGPANGAEDAGAPASTPPDAATGTQGDPEILVGAFTVELVPRAPATAQAAEIPAFVSVLGRVYDGTTPRPVAWVPLSEAGGCVVLEPTHPFCDPDCDNSEVCVADDECRAYPETVDVGTVTMDGLAREDGSRSFTMEPLPPSNTYQPRADVDLRYPPFEAGDAVRLGADGGDAAAFGIDTVGIAPLVLTTSGPVRFEEDAPVLLEWEPGAEPAARIEVVVDISHHGGQRGEIRCDAPDSGSLEIPAEIVTGLLALGWSGFPTLRIARETIGSTVIATGRVELLVSSAAVLPIEIPGLTSCSEIGAEGECPDGETCQADLRCE